METNVFKNRRLQLAEKFSRTLLVISSGQESKRSHSVAYRFKVASDFFYLTGVDLQDAILIVAGKDQYLLSKAFSHESAVWDDQGFLSEVDRLNLSGVHFESLDKLSEIMHTYLGGFDRLAFAIGRSEELDQKLLSFIAFEKRLSRRTSVPIAICDSRLLVGTLRLKKDSQEINQMKEAGLRSSEVHTALMKQTFAGRSERDIANWIDAQFTLQGMSWTAYQTIVGSGDRSTLLHARATDRIIQKDELVLIDAGGEWHSYCADITRVVTSGTRFSKQQAELYKVVLKAQKEIIAAVKPGTDLQQLHRLSLEVMSQGLLELGYSPQLIHTDIKKLMPHSTSHWIGLDVHDPSAYVTDSGEQIKLEAGMCFTIEPGLYFRDGITELAQYQGLGVRIEDDIVVTTQGHELLSSVPKELEEIEDLLSQRS